MNVRSDLAMAYRIGYEDALAKRMPNATKAGVLNSLNCSNNCTNSERTETCHIDLVGYNQHEDRLQCRSCNWSMWFKHGTGPQFNFCPNCGRKVIN